MPGRPKRPGKPPWPPMTDDPCPRCKALAEAGKIRPEMVQRLPEGAAAPMATPGEDEYRGKCCFDCASADGLLRAQQGVPGFIAARIAVGNDRQHQCRLPGVPMGLVAQGLVRPSKRGDLEKHYEWLDKHDWFNTRGEEVHG